MRIKASLVFVAASLLSACADRPEPAAASDAAVETAKQVKDEAAPAAPTHVSPGEGTLGGRYPLLPTGVLAHAQLGELPDGVLVRAKDVEITADAIAAVIASQPEEYHAELSREEFFILEQELEHRLLVALGSRMIGAEAGELDAQQERAAIMALIESMAEGATVSSAEIRSFYDSNTELFGGASFEDMRGPIEQHLLEEKRFEAISERIRRLGREVEIVVSEAYAAEAARMTAESPVGAARMSGKPSMVVFGGTACCGTDFSKPLVARMSAVYGDKLSMVPLDAQENQVLAARCGIRSIPTIILYDSAGLESERLSGHVEDDEVMAALSRIGVR